jgi:hypothetical protein
MEKDYVQEMEAKYLLQGKVRAISSSKESEPKKIELLDTLFMQTLSCGSAIDPYENQFYNNRGEYKSRCVNTTLISQQVNFTSIMEFAIKAHKPNIIELAFKNGANPNEEMEDPLERTILPAIAQALKFSTSSNAQEIIMVFKKYDANFNILLPGGETLLHHHINNPALAILLMEHTNIPVNQQNIYGNTIAHLLPDFSTNEMHINFFNALIMNNINVHIKNLRNQTAKEAATLYYNATEKSLATVKSSEKIPYYENLKIRRRINPHLLDRLERGFSPQDRFVITDCLITYKNG